MTPDPPAVSTTIDEGRYGARVATVAFGPWRINVFGRDLIEELTAAFVRLAEDDELRLAVLSGGIGQAFSMGANVNEMAAIADADEAVSFITSLHNLCQSIRDLPVPVIARIEGHCLGGGLEVAASCDLRIASEGSMFGMPEVRLGLPSVIEAALLPSLIGWGKTRELLYTGDTIDSAEALRIGLVERVVPANRLDEELAGWVRSIAIESDAAAIRLQKRLIQQWEVLPIGDAVQAGIDSFRVAFADDTPQKLMQQWIDRPRGD
jgi:enoyl-CoA hydratase/carnithine racemase